MSPSNTETATKVFIEQIKVTHVRKSSKKDFDLVLRTFESLLGKPSLESIAGALKESGGGNAEIQAMAGASGLMILGCLDMHSSVLHLKQNKIRSLQYLVGNPVVADSMIKHNLEAALYAPLRILLSEDAEGTFFVYDRPSSLFGQWHSLEIDNVAVKLDQLLDNLIDTALKLDSPI